MTPKKPKKALVTTRAVVQRINRKLSAKMQGIRMDRRTGRYLLIDLERGEVRHEDVPLEAYAREIGALEPWEEIEK